MDEFCTITRDGSSICVPLSVGRLSEGTVCGGFESLQDAQSRTDGICAPGLGCFQDGFYSRCLRFCESSASDTQDACRGRIDVAYAHPFGEDSVCAMRVFDRTEIGACRLKCEFGGSGESAGCPEGATCGLTPDAYEARCLPEGRATEGETCNLSCPCSSGLVCVADNRTERCRQTGFVGGCGDTAFRQQISGTRDPHVSTQDEWVPYEYCPRCVRIMVMSSEKPLWLCAASACESTDQLIDMHGLDVGVLTDQVRNLIGEEFSAVVGLVWREDGWYWPSGDAPVPVEGEMTQGDCVVLSASGSLRVEQTCSGFRLCETSSFSRCTTEGE